MAQKNKQLAAVHQKLPPPHSGLYLCQMPPDFPNSFTTELVSKICSEVTNKSSTTP